MWKDLSGEVAKMFDHLVGCGYFEETTGYRVVVRHGPKPESTTDRAAYKREWNARNAERERERKRAWAKSPAGLEAKRRWKERKRTAA